MIIWIKFNSEKSMGDKTKRDDEVTRRGPVNEVVKWFDRNTTLGGWTPAFHSDNKWSRFFWTVLLLIGVSLTLTSIGSLIQQVE